MYKDAKSHLRPFFDWFGWKNWMVVVWRIFEQFQIIIDYVYWLLSCSWKLCNPTITNSHSRTTSYHSSKLLDSPPHFLTTLSPPILIKDTSQTELLLWSAKRLLASSRTQSLIEKLQLFLLLSYTTVVGNQFDSDIIPPLGWGGFKFEN